MFKMVKELDKSKVHFAFNLLQFSDDGGDGSGGGDGGDGGDKGADGGDKGDKGGKNDEPFATFKDEASFMSRIKREAKKLSGDQQAEFLKSLGVEDADTLKTILAAHNKKVEDEKTEAQKLQDKIANLENEKSSALAQAQGILKTAEAKLVATELGIKPERIEKFLKLNDLAEIKVGKDGSIDRDEIKSILSATLTEFPEFKTVATPPAGGKGGSDFGGSGKDSNPSGKKITIEDVKKMSTAEIEANMEEVMKVMAGQK